MHPENPRLEKAYEALKAKGLLGFFSFNEDPIGKDVLNKMASVCKGNNKAIYEKLVEITKLREKQYRRAIVSARIGLDIEQNRLELKRKNAVSAKEIAKIKKTASDLVEQYHSLSNHTLDTWVESYIYQEDDYEEKYGAWDDISEMLEGIVAIFEGIERAHKKEKGRPKKLNGLSDYIYQIAMLYEECTGRKFTVDEYRVGGIPEAITEGQKFAETAMPMIYTTLPNESYLRIYYTITRSGQKIDYKVRLTRTFPRYGGERLWFICPATRKRVAKLYLHPGGDIFASRQAYRLSYSSQSETSYDRAIRKMWKLKNRLGGEDYYFRPKGMHQKTFDRLINKTLEAEERVGGLFVAHFGKFAKRVGMPPLV